VTKKGRPADTEVQGRSEEQMLEAIRKLTEDTRKARLELEALVNHPRQDRSRSFSDDRVAGRRTPSRRRRER
jgi:hypothetical protein